MEIIIGSIVILEAFGTRDSLPTALVKKARGAAEMTARKELSSHCHGPKALLRLIHAVHEAFLFH
jgi:hypothetical protein